MAAPPLLLLRSRSVLRKASATVQRGSFSKLPAAAAESLPSVARPVRRTSSIHRLPLISVGLLSSLPLHTAIASCRLRSVLSAESQSWGLIPQGNSMPL